MRRGLAAALGVLALGMAWIAPLHVVLPGPFAAHMTMHMGVVAVAAPLLALALAGSPYDPVRRAPWLFAAIPASVVELFAVWGWHAPTLHQLARHTTRGLLAEQAMFLVTGLFVWLSALGGGARDGGSRTGAGIVALLLTSMHMTLLGALLALAPRPLYTHAHTHAHDTHGTALAPLDDQQLGGAIMLLVGGAAYLAGGLGLVVVLLRRRGAPEGARCPS